MEENKYSIYNILSENCVYNILGHVKECWNYDYPTGKTLESAIFRGIQPFYPDAKNLGSPSTIVDVGKGDEAFDIKGCKVLGHVTKTGKASNHDKNIFVEQEVPGKGKIKVKIPQEVVTQVRRPKVDLKGYTGDPEAAIKEQVQDYHNFAIQTTNKDGYKELHSIVVQYGIDEKKGYKSVYMTMNGFEIPAVTKYEVGVKEDGTPCSYQGTDENGKAVFSLSSFNAGSSNFYKRFTTNEGVLFTWSTVEHDTKVYTKEELEVHGAIKNVENK